MLERLETFNHETSHPEIEPKNDKPEQPHKQEEVETIPRSLVQELSKSAAFHFRT